jgi:hypothetical protein
MILTTPLTSDYRIGYKTSESEREYEATALRNFTLTSQQISLGFLVFFLIPLFEFLYSHSKYECEQVIVYILTLFFAFPLLDTCKCVFCSVLLYNREGED